MNTRVIEVVDYKPEWLNRYNSESLLLKEVLGAVAVNIHHIGSTSVPGLSAKDLVDIMVEVTSLNNMDTYNPDMSALDYEVKGEFGIPGRRFFMKGVNNRTHHVHAFPAGDPHVTRHLAFRDFLRNNSEARDEYEAVKKDAAERCNNDMEIYCKLKDPFIKKHEIIALEQYGDVTTAPGF